MNFPLALSLVTLTGYIALSYELLWARVYSFASYRNAPAFGLMLGAYLAGIAFGALASTHFVKKGEDASERHLEVVASFVLLSNLAGFLLVPLVAWAVTKVPYPVTLFMVGVEAMLLGAALPLICHISIPCDRRVGPRMSYIYLANIIGSTAGSLLTGFVLMNHFPLRQISIFLAFMGLLLTALILYSGRRGSRFFAFKLAGIGLAAVLVFLFSRWLYDGIWEKLQLRRRYVPSYKFAFVVENRSGVISVTPDGEVWGGGSYMGKMKIDLIDDRWMVRPFALSLFHPEPREVLVVGMGGGAWTQIFAHHPQVEMITAIEINPGYLEVIRRSRDMSSLLRNPRVKVVIDDGRRWLKRNPNRRFDAIVSNTIYPHRSFSTSLLSREFFRSVSRHLKPDGIFMFNANDSKDAWKTSMAVFPHTMLLVNNVVASNHPLRLDAARWRRVLETYKINGTPVFDLSKELHRRRLDEVLSTAAFIDENKNEEKMTLRSRAYMQRNTVDARLITDDNMQSEWKWLRMWASR